MVDKRNAFRKFARHCRNQAEDAVAADMRELQLKLAEIVKATEAEIKSDNALLSALREVVQNMPIRRLPFAYLPRSST